MSLTTLELLKPLKPLKNVPRLTLLRACKRVNRGTFYSGFSGFSSSRGFSDIGGRGANLSRQAGCRGSESCFRRQHGETKRVHRAGQ